MQRTLFKPERTKKELLEPSRESQSIIQLSLFQMSFLKPRFIVSLIRIIS